MALANARPALTNSIRSKSDRCRVKTEKPEKSGITKRKPVKSTASKRLGPCCAVLPILSTIGQLWSAAAEESAFTKRKSISVPLSQVKMKQPFWPKDYVSETFCKGSLRTVHYRNGGEGGIRVREVCGRSVVGCRSPTLQTKR
jgi:hypothetical protein